LIAGSWGSNPDRPFKIFTFFFLDPLGLQRPVFDWDNNGLSICRRFPLKNWVFEKTHFSLSNRPIPYQNIFVTPIKNFPYQIFFLVNAISLSN
jgi:hypothetical protein